MKLALPVAFIAVLIIGFNGCQKMPNDGVPIYLKVDSATFKITNSNQGTYNSDNITDIWVEANTTNLGAYELPANFPILAENNVRFTLSAGIWESGQSGSRVVYPFYEVDTFTIASAQRGSVYSHIPEFHYKAAAVFPFKDDFNTSNSFDSSSLSNTDAMPGAGNYMALYVSSSDSSKTAEQKIPVDLPEGQEVWLEVDYKSDVPFWIGFYGYSAGGIQNTQYDFMYVNARSTWRKLYVKFSEALTQVRTDKYAVYFRALNTTGTGGTVCIDNAKLVTF